MNMEYIKWNIDKIYRENWGRVQFAARDLAIEWINCPNKLPEKQFAAAEKLIEKLEASYQKKQDRERKAAAKAREKEASAAKKLGEKLRFLQEENPYYISNGSERIVDLSVRAVTRDRRLGRFQGKASIQIPAALKWAQYCAKSDGHGATIVDFGNEDRPMIAKFDSFGNKI